MLKLLLALFLSVAYAAPADTLRSAEGAALRGDYEEAKKVAEPLASDPELDAALKPRLFLLMARVATAYEDHAAAHRWLEQLYRVDPHAKLDRYTDPPTMFKAWDEIVAASPPPPSFESNLKVASKTWLAMVPFGIGHFASDDAIFGAMFCGIDIFGLYFMARYANFGSWVFATGAYGYELWHLGPAMRSSSLVVARAQHRILGYMPLGLPQLRNGEVWRAVAVAGVHLATLGVMIQADNVMRQEMEQTRRSMFTESDVFRSAQRRSLIAGGVFALSYAYSALDGWIRDPGAPTAAIVPGPNGRGAALVLSGALP